MKMIRCEFEASNNTIFFISFSNLVFAQRGYKKDSLQIKVYTEIEYVQYRVKSVKVVKVFCDYCSELQTKK